MDFLDPNDIWKFRETVLSRVSIIEIAQEYGLNLESKETGAFTHRTYCPLHAGKGRGGQERTPSMFFSKHSNSFCCFGCLDENTLVWTQKGLIKMGSINIGDFVLGHDGLFHRVSNKMLSKSNSIVSISTKSSKNGKLILTNNHKCMCIKKEDMLDAVPYIYRNKHRSFGMKFAQRRKNDRGVKLQISTILAENLKKGDFLLFPIISEQHRQIKPLIKKGVVRKYYKGPKTDRIFSLPISKELCWLYGLWLAEGSRGRGFIRFSFHYNERYTLAVAAKKILLKEFNVKSTIFDRKEKNICELIACKTDLELLFTFWFNSGAENKKLPVEFMSLPAEFQKSIIKGYFDGDGCYKNNTSSTVSKELALGMYSLCIQAGLLPSIYFRPKYVDKNNVKHKDCWFVAIKKRESISGFIETINNVKYYISVIDNISFSKEDRNVVDITVDRSSSFTTAICVVHNCGKSGSVLDFVSYMDGTPTIIALTKLAKKIGLIDKDGNWDELQLGAIEKREAFDPNKTIDPYIFRMSDLLRSYIGRFANNDSFEKELKWMERVAAKADSFLANIGYEDWEYAKDLYEKVDKAVKNRLRMKGE